MFLNKEEFLIFIAICTFAGIIIAGIYAYNKNEETISLEQKIKVCLDSGGTSIVYIDKTMSISSQVVECRWED